VDGEAHHQMVAVILHIWWWIIGFHQNVEFLHQERNLLPLKKRPCTMQPGERWY